MTTPSPRHKRVVYGAERRVLVVPLHQQRDALLALLESEDRNARRLQRRDRRTDRRGEVTRVTAIGRALPSLAARKTRLSLSICRS